MRLGRTVFHACFFKMINCNLCIAPMRKFYLYVNITGLLLICFSCNQVAENKTAVQILAAETVSDTTSLRKEEMITSSGKTILLEITHPRGASLCDITIAFKGDTTTRLTLSDQDPVSTYTLADLDGNGFSELYIVTTSAGTGSYGNLCGFASNKDKSFSFIYFPELTEKDLEPGKAFHGYEGKDSFAVKQQKIVRYYSVSTNDTSLQKSCSYKLKQTETGFALLPDNVTGKH